jgi:hypothetical protein
MSISHGTFTSVEYSSNDGMLTSVWGPALWHYLHTMSFNYPVNPTAEQKFHYRNMVESLQYTLPCGACRDNLKKNLEKCKLTNAALKNRDTFSRWMFRLHEEVNTMLGKSSGLTYGIVRDRYENFRARCNKEKIIETGCTEPVIGVKSKCVISIVPKELECQTFNVHRGCLSKRISK